MDTPSNMDEDIDFQDLVPDDPSFTKLQRSLPYPIDPNSKMQELLDLYLIRITQCVEAKEYQALTQWDIMWSLWRTLEYPIAMDKRICLAKVFFQICIIPGMPGDLVSSFAASLQLLIKSKKKVSIQDLRLPWKPIYKILEKDLFLSRRQFEISSVTPNMAFIAEACQRFFHPAAADEMLAHFLPKINGLDLDSVLAAHYYLVTFLPRYHPQKYLPMMFQLWNSFNSEAFDDRQIAFMADLAELHVDPSESDPIISIPDDADDLSETGGERVTWGTSDLGQPDGGEWLGIWKDVGIFTTDEWSFIMCKCLASMEIPLADHGSLSTGSAADQSNTFELDRLPKPPWRIISLARLIIYSMALDGLTAPPSGMATPVKPGMPSLGQTHAPKHYLAGSKALDSLVRLLNSVESFFHPSNSGVWTSDLSAFVKYLSYQFTKRWEEEQLPTCKTPQSRRLTPLMKRELVKCLRTVSLLALFSQDSTTVGNIQVALKSMTVMEPDLILQPILERAGPALDNLINTDRTFAAIQGLNAVTLALISRETLYGGSKHVLSLLEILLPAIDSNDASKTVHAAAFIGEIASYIQFGDISSVDISARRSGDDLLKSPQDSESNLMIPEIVTSSESIDVDDEPPLSRAEEDRLLRETTAGFADWLTNFFQRIILLLENLPDEGVPGAQAGGDLEASLVDSLTAACNQICVHLSDSLFDLVLNLVFDYASTNVKPNAIRGIHQLVSCMAHANAAKTLAKFVPSCLKNIASELENGASALRTTTTSQPRLSDAPLHSNLAMLRGAIQHDGLSVMKYKDDLKNVIALLHDKTLTSRGYSWTAYLLGSIFGTITSTYPLLQERFVNPDTWESQDFRANHHLYWGKTYEAEDVKIDWHIPSTEEISFAIELLVDLVSPTLTLLENSLLDGIVRDSVWRNDFCRRLSFVRSAISSSTILCQEALSDVDVRTSSEKTDFINILPEFLGAVSPIKSGFLLTDQQDPRYKTVMSLRCRFGKFLHLASQSLIVQTDGNTDTVDAITILLGSYRTYLLDFGDPRNNYTVQQDRYNEVKSVARLTAKQTMWPRTVWVRRARLNHARRLRWNSVGRLHSDEHTTLVNDLLEWSMWHYATIRATSQSILSSFCSTFDGFARQCLRTLYKSLTPGTPDDRMKGALYTLNVPMLVKYAMQEPSQTNEFLNALFSCQHNEKPSIQNCVSPIFENCLANLAEPCSLVYLIDSPSAFAAADELKGLLPSSLCDPDLVERCRAQRILRLSEGNEATNRTVNDITLIGASDETHWRYQITAIRILRALVRRDIPPIPNQIRYFLNNVHANHPSLRYYAQRAIMKTLRYIKLRTTCRTPSELALFQNRNPLKRTIAITQPTHAFTAAYLHGFCNNATHDLLFHDKDSSGWLIWDSISSFLPPSSVVPTFSWEPASLPAIETLRDVTCDPSFWKSYITRLSEENDFDEITQDNISCIKSICQILEVESFDVMRPEMEGLLEDTDQNKQRALAELLAGIIGGSKHWTLTAQKKVWDWLTPQFPAILKQNIRTDTIDIWSTFIEYLSHTRDPKRVQPMVQYIVDSAKAVDFNGESSFEAFRAIGFIISLKSELKWRFTPWIDDFITQMWPELGSEHGDVRTCIADMLSTSVQLKWRPRPSVPTAEVFVRECRTASISRDIMGIRHGYRLNEFLALLEELPKWREERFPGARAPSSKYDRVGTTITSWLYLGLHEVNANQMYQYILPFMPELFRMSEINDSDELASRAHVLLIRLFGVIPPLEYINPVLEAVIEPIQHSPSWRIRMGALPVLQVLHFRQLPLISENQESRMLAVLCDRLHDEVIEVREMAARTLSGILRCSTRQNNLKLKDRFVQLAKQIELPARQSPQYHHVLRTLHGAILGVCALIESTPYTIPMFLPSLFSDVLLIHTYAPSPISTTVRQCASNFKKSHTDTWAEDSLRFNEEQLSALSTLIAGSSYYA